MNTQTIFYFAIGVFTLMVIGIVLTGREFRKLMEESASRKDRSDRG